MKRLFTYLLLLCSFGLKAQINSSMVMVQAPSTAPDSIASSNASHLVCPGETVELTAVGGLLGTNAQWTWYTDGCGIGTSIDTGTSIFVTPLSPISHYYCTATGGCNMPCVTLTLYLDTVTSNCTVLPLHLLSFDAKLYKENKGRITWETADEEKRTQYDLLKATDGKNFSFLTHMEAKAAPGKNNYRYIDEKLKTGNNFYRLKITYPNKEIVFSEVKLIKYLKDDDWVKLYPNPTEGIIYFEFDGKVGEEVQVWVSNIIGQSIQKRMVIYAEDGRNFVKMDLSGFAQGAYLFNYQNSNGKSQVIKFVKTN